MLTERVPTRPGTCRYPHEGHPAIRVQFPAAAFGARVTARARSALSHLVGAWPIVDGVLSIRAGGSGHRGYVNIRGQAAGDIGQHTGTCTRRERCEERENAADRVELGIAAQRSVSTSLGLQDNRSTLARLGQ